MIAVIELLCDQYALFGTRELILYYMLSVSWIKEAEATVLVFALILAFISGVQQVF